MRQITAFRSKKDLVYDSLRAAILQGDLRPGERLIIDDLAAELGVSQIPVREALQQLQADGFVTIEPYVGATVADLQAEGIVEIFALLEAMESISSQIAAQRMTEQDLAEIEAHLRAMDGMVTDLDQWSEANIQLHQLLCEKAGTRLVGMLMRKVADHWERMRRIYLNDVFAYRVADAQREHWLILEALKSRDLERIAQIVREHNRAARQAYVEHLQRSGHLETPLVVVQ
ncbi:MAG: GntR family transcriptional regulator [Anaerolineae bacterium]